MATNQMATQPPPIGLLLITLDRLINERFDEAIGGHSVSRRQWQLLNLLAKGDTTSAELTAELTSFLDSASGESALQHLEPLARRGLVRSDGEVWALTDAGRDWFGVLAREVQAVREQTVAGLETGEYEAVVTGLQKMIGNLRGER